MPFYDASRQADIRKMQGVIDDPNKPASEKKRASEALYAIQNQSKYPSIAKLRRDITLAHQRHDQEAIDRLTKQAQHIDRDYANS